MYLFDKELELRDGAGAAITVTTAEAGKALDVLKAGDFKVVFHVRGLASGGASPETYNLTVEVDALVAFGSPIEVGNVLVDTALGMTTGLYEVPLSSRLIEKLDANAAAIRCKATLAGTAPSLLYGCFLVPVN